VIGWLGAGTLESRRSVVATFHNGLAELGYYAGQNVAFECRWAEEHLDRLPALAAELVSVMVNTAGLIAAKAATKSIPIVFLTGLDVVASGIIPA
jgi:putative ABC transport system substrate-binding protein